MDRFADLIHTLVSKSVVSGDWVRGDSVLLPPSKVRRLNLAIV